MELLEAHHGHFKRSRCHQRLQHSQKAGVRLTESSHVLQPRESIGSWKHSEVVKVV